MFSGRCVFGGLCVFLIFITTTSLHASQVHIPKNKLLPSANYMPEGARTFSPLGHIEFCNKHPGECIAHPGSRADGRFHLNGKTWKELVQVNSRINSSLRSRSDYRSHGRLDVWSLASRYGDCEDYVLLKRRLLMKKGWPSSALIIATAKDHLNRPHAVLVARTDRGDFVLDNLNSKVRAWNKVRYTWNKRQSSQNPRVWVSFSKRLKAPKQFQVKARANSKRLQNLLKLATSNKEVAKRIPLPIRKPEPRIQVAALDYDVVSGFGNWNVDGE